MNRILHRRISSLSLLMAAFLLAGGILPASAQQSAPPAPSFSTSQLAVIAQEAGEAAEQALRATGGSAVSIALGDGAGTVWAGQYGFSDKVAGKAPSADTMFGIGSTSKMFATAAAMILVDKGLVQLDMPLVRYLPEFRMATPGYEKITVRMLLNHSAGFPGTDYRNGISRAPIKGYPEQIEATLAESRLKHEPGWMNVYANDGFTMVELLVKAMTGLDFTEFVAKELLAPLGMNHSRYPLAPFPEGTFAKAYKGDQFSGQEYLGPLASGGLYSTPSDLTRFAAMLIKKGSLQGKTILSSTSVAAMAVDQTANTFNPLRGDSFRYGLGWDSVSQPGMAALGFLAWEKGGDTNSYGSVLIVLPDEGISVAVTGASGVNSGTSTTIAERVLARALVEKGRLAAMPAPAPAASRPIAPLPAELIKNMPGIYSTFNKVYKINLGAEGSLSMQGYTNTGWANALEGMTYRDDGWFSASGDGAPPVDISWMVADGRDYLALRMPSENGWYQTKMLFAQKLEPEAALSPAWQKRLGKAWLPVNYTEAEDYLGAGTDPRAWLEGIEGAEGYVVFSGADGMMTTKPALEGGDKESRSFILIPLVNGRDLFDLNMIERNGEEWLRQTSTLYRPLDSVPTLKFGESLVPIGPEGYAEWRHLPAETRFSVSGARAIKLYDADFILRDLDSDTVDVGGGYLAIFGAPGSVARIVVSSSSTKPSSSLPSYTAEQTARIAEAGRKAAESVMKASGGSALTAALVDESGVVWVEQFGLADKETKSAANANTMFGIGSVSKMFAAASAMILVDRNLVNLDAPLSMYLPEFTMADPRYKDITVRMILNHSAGLPGADLRNAATLVPYTELANQALQSLKTERLKHAPGFMSVYANDGFSLAELLVEAVSGIRFTDFARREIFAPLGMEHSRYPMEKFPDESYAHVYAGEEAAPWYFLNMYGTGALYSTPTDMAKFAMMLASGGEYDGKRILSEVAVRAMALDQTAGTFNPLPTDYMRFGLGWDTVVQPGMNALGLRGWQKGGDVTGLYGATMIVLPDEHMAAIVAGASGISSGGSSEVAESVLLRALVEKGLLAAMPLPVAGSAAAQRQPGIAERIAIEGYYAASGTLLRARFSSESALSVERMNGGEWSPFASGYTARADGWYSSDDPAAISLRFIDTEKGRYFGIRIKSGFGHYTVPLLYAQKLENAPPLSEAWKARTNETWLLANETPSLAEPGDVTDPRVKVASPSELPGYISYAWDGGINMVRPVSGDVSLATMFLLIPGAQGRDLNDLVSEKIGETEYLHVGGARFRAASTVPGLGILSGNRQSSLSRSVLVGKDGFGEWSKIAAPSEQASAISVAGSTLWRLYDEDFVLVASGAAEGKASLPKSAGGSWLVTYGAPGSTIELRLIP